MRFTGSGLHSRSDILKKIQQILCFNYKKRFKKIECPALWIIQFSNNFTFAGMRIMISAVKDLTSTILISAPENSWKLLFRIRRNQWVPNPLQALGTKFALKKSSPSGDGFFRFLAKRKPARHQPDRFFHSLLCFYSFGRLFIARQPLDSK